MCYLDYSIRQLRCQGKGERFELLYSINGSIVAYAVIARPQLVPVYHKTYLVLVLFSLVLPHISIFALHSLAPPRFATQDPGSHSRHSFPLPAHTMFVSRDCRSCLRLFYWHFTIWRRVCIRTVGYPHQGSPTQLPDTKHRTYPRK